LISKNRELGFVILSEDENLLQNEFLVLHSLVLTISYCVSSAVSAAVLLFYKKERKEKKIMFDVRS
jgi:hypothetical protein